MRILIIGSCLWLLSGCASILSDSTYPVTFGSQPPGAEIEVTNRRGEVVYAGKSPTTLSLRSGSGFFRGERYTVRASMNDGTGIATLVPGVDGWYFGNILFGGLIGMLIVDPATGAMYRLPPRFEVNIVERRADSGHQQLQIIDIAEVPKEFRSLLIALRE